MLRSLGLYLKIPLQDGEIAETNLFTQPLGVKILVGKCDDCGKVDVAEVAYGAYRFPGWYGDNAHDLCPDCSDLEKKPKR